MLNTIGMAQNLDNYKQKVKSLINIGAASSISSVLMARRTSHRAAFMTWLLHRTDLISALGNARTSFLLSFKIFFWEPDKFQERSKSVKGVWTQITLRSSGSLARPENALACNGIRSVSSHWPSDSIDATNR